MDKWKLPESRRVKPSDVVDAFMGNTDREDQISRLDCKIEALESLCEALIALLPAKTQLAIIVARRGAPVGYSGYHQVELTE